MKGKKGRTPPWGSPFGGWTAKRKGNMRVKRKLAAWDDSFLREVIGADPEG